jgi:hypothetical protein
VDKDHWDPLVDGVWTPGEAFLDSNTNNVYDYPSDDEDRWTSSNVFGFPANVCGEPIGSPTRPTSAPI